MNTVAVTALLICLAGGIGASARLVLDVLIRDRVSSSYPVAATVINVTVSLLLGLVTGLAARQLLPHPWQLVVGTGLIGGYTTFCTASFETVRLLEDERHLAAALNGIGLLAVSVFAAALGYAAAGSRLMTGSRPARTPVARSPARTVQG